MLFRKGTHVRRGRGPEKDPAGQDRVSLSQLFDPEEIPGLHAALCDLDTLATMAHAAAYSEGATDALYRLDNIVQEVRWLRRRWEAQDRSLWS